MHATCREASLQRLRLALPGVTTSVPLHGYRGDGGCVLPGRRRGSLLGGRAADASDDVVDETVPMFDSTCDQRRDESLVPRAPIRRRRSSLTCRAEVVGGGSVARRGGAAVFHGTDAIPTNGPPTIRAPAVARVAVRHCLRRDGARHLHRQMDDGARRARITAGYGLCATEAETMGDYFTSKCFTGTRRCPNISTAAGHASSTR